MHKFMNMWRIFSITLFLFLTCAAAWAMESFPGRIQAIDSDRGVISVEMIQRRTREMHQPPPRKIQVFLPMDAIPFFIKRDAPIWIWGNFLPGREDYFEAQRIRPFRGHGDDPTGVRLRLGNPGKSCRINHEKHNGEEK